jgi:ABC-type transport system involved in multi-copper enzyme maturation permease subunit
MSTQTIVFLVIGVVIVVVTGRLLAVAGRGYLSTPSANPNDRASNNSAALLVSVLFHLITLGLVAFISVVPVAGTPATAMMLRIGILLIVLGLVFAVTVSVLRRRREDDMVAESEIPLSRQPVTPRSGVRVDPAVMNDPRIGGEAPAEPMSPPPGVVRS